MIETFKRRKTTFDDIVAFEEEYVKDSQRNKRWNSFVKKKKVMIKVDLSEAIYVIQNLLKPIVDSIKTGDEFDEIWQLDPGKWMS
ncbi:MAG: hypothetical protein WBA54_00765 [Acidaminobacteraceae bacterium]